MLNVNRYPTSRNAIKVSNDKKGWFATRSFTSMFLFFSEDAGRSAFKVNPLLSY